MKTRFSTGNVAAKRGFTLVELSVASIATAILALTVGTMLWFGYLGWSRLNAAVQMQRDMQVAMDILTRIVRSGTNVTVSAGPVVTVQSSDRPDTTVYTSGSSLMCNPSVGSGGAPLTVANGTVRQFEVWQAAGMTTVVLVLQSGGETLSNQIAIARRN